LLPPLRVVTVVARPTLKIGNSEIGNTSWETGVEQAMGQGGGPPPDFDAMGQD